MAEEWEAEAKVVGANLEIVDWVAAGAAAEKAQVATA